MPEPLLWGFVEVSSFLFLFLTPFLNDQFVEAGWLSLAAGRAAAVAGWLYLSGSVERTSVQERARGLGRALAYSVPFWCSAVFFSLRPGQMESVLFGLTISVVLSLLAFLLSFLRTHWLPSFLGVIMFLGFEGLEQPFFYLPLVLALGPLLYKRSDPEFGEQNLLVLLGSGGFAFCLYLGMSASSLGLRPLARGVACWLLLCAMAGHLLGKARIERSRRCTDREVELALPGLAMGLTWSYRRLWMNVWMSWLSFLVLILWDVNSVYLLLASLLAVPGLWHMSGKGRVSEEVLSWWCCGQFLILWGIAETDPDMRLAWLPVAFLLSLLMWFLGERSLPGPELSLCHGQGKMESALSTGLRVKAPENFSKLLLQANYETSVDFDDELTSRAPSGFRERLLARLKDSSVSSDEDDSEEY